MTNSPTLDKIAIRFIASAEQDNFNGIVASTLLDHETTTAELRAAISSLIQGGQITAVFSRTDVNMHIKRFPDMSIERQLSLLVDEPLNAFCLYPSSPTVQSRVDLSKWQNRPFSKALLLATPQISFRAFDMGALERYVSDPRYTVRFEDYMGTMSINNEFFADTQHPERDKVSLKTFGLGFDERHNPYVIVFLRYLARLSPEHQQYWSSYSAGGDVRMSKPYFDSSIGGKFWKNRSVRYAITEEIRLIKMLSESIWGCSLFRACLTNEIPIDLTLFLRPTAENFNRFVMALDKLLSDSIDPKFFNGRVPLEIETFRPDGKVQVQRKGTLKLLEEWMRKEVSWDDPEAFHKVIIGPLRKVRHLRSKPAHTITPDSYSTMYRDERKSILWDVFTSLSNIRATFKKHPRATAIRIPDWLNDGDIDVF